MKTITLFIRIFTGILFIFSGIVKAIDPRGLAYKMQEFFEVWTSAGFLPKLMTALHNNALPFSIAMITLEVMVGVALLLGYKKQITSCILLLLMLFFTFLTAFVLFTGKIRACGCFGDCIPLTPIQTFTKDIILLLFAVVLLFNLKYITPVAKPFLNTLYVLLAVILTFWLQTYVLKNLPIIDCLPYKKGNNIIELRKMPANAIQDKYSFMFVYEKNGKQQEFEADKTPDSTWTFIDRKQTLIQKGSNNVPLINDYSLTTLSGTDTTNDILNTKEPYYLLYINDVENYPRNWNEDATILLEANKTNKKIFIVSAQVSKAQQHFYDMSILKPIHEKLIFLSCDVTVLKTVARVNPTLYLMQGPIVKNKWGYNNFGKVF